MKEKLKQLSKQKSKGFSSKYNYFPIIFGLLGFVLLCAEEGRPSPFGCLFLGFGLGGFCTDYVWNKNSKTAWNLIKNYIDWEKVDEEVNDTPPNIENSNPFFSAQRPYILYSI